MTAYGVARGVFRVLAKLLFRLQVQGQERVPSSGPVVIVAPHRSWLDPACVGAACPRPVRFLMQEDVYRKRWAHWFYRSMGAIPLRPDGENSVAALRSALRVLARGEVIGVFPEGRIVHRGETPDVRAGAALLAARAGAVVVPLLIHGTAQAWPHGKRCPRPATVRASFAEPLLTGPAASGRLTVDALSEQIERFLKNCPS